jgi:hypothetical protein
VSGRGRLCYVVSIRKRIYSRLFVYDRVFSYVLVILIRSITCFTLFGIVSNKTYSRGLSRLVTKRDSTSFLEFILISLLGQQLLAPDTA